MGKEKMICPYPLGEGWVCENHGSRPFYDGDKTCCGGAGMPCACNKVNPPWDYINEAVEDEDETFATPTAYSPRKMAKGKASLQAPRGPGRPKKQV